MSKNKKLMLRIAVYSLVGIYIAIDTNQLPVLYISIATILIAASYHQEDLKEKL